MATATYMREWRRTHRGTLGPDDPRHGTRTGYDNWGCRCEACTAANAASQMDYQRRLGVKMPLADRLAQRRQEAWAKPCGTVSKYSLGCRCPECREASRLAKARWRAASTQDTKPNK